MVLLKDNNGARKTAEDELREVIAGSLSIVVTTLWGDCKYEGSLWRTLI